MNNKLFSSGKRGFTFVELLVVITIIAILTGAAAVSFTNTSIRSRDSRRKLDIENIRSALELCRTESGSYPPSIYNSISCGGETYLNDTPKDPKTDATYTYGFVSATSYTITCVLESGDSCSFINP
jgi:prepilin-type N-terminal cleavage/methylation domain-containing protein